MFERIDSATALECLAPGPELAGLLAADPGELSGYDLVSYLGATERLTAWAQSRQLAAIREHAVLPDPRHQRAGEPCGLSPTDSLGDTRQ